MDVYTRIIVENILYYVSNIHSSQIEQLFIKQNTIFFCEIFTTYCCEINKLTDTNTYTDAGTHTHTHTHDYASMYVSMYVYVYVCMYVKRIFMSACMFSSLYLVYLFHIPLIYTDVEAFMYTFSIINEVDYQHTLCLSVVSQDSYVNN
jgi:hypothetical protein